MPLRLYGKQLQAFGATSSAPFVVRVNESGTLTGEGACEAFLSRGREVLPIGFRAYLCCSERASVGERDAYLLGPDMHYLREGDVLRIDPRGTARVLYRRDSRFNALLLTERCDNYCVMCSQPPKTADDSWIVDELLTAIPMMSPETREIGITGGEPALLGDRFLAVLRALRDHLPNAAVHVLSNGRAFARAGFAQQLAALEHRDLMIGVPVYSDLAEEHDYVVQARGAFNETIRGILNLKENRVRVEIRVVIHADTYGRLPELARFVARNLVFADHIALMGLEPVGFAKANLASLWIDPLDYQEQLVDAVRTLDRAGANVSIYNHQLCVLDRRLHRFARKSISDWKNSYFSECDDCAAREPCAGFFSSASNAKSRGIRAVATTATP